MTDPFKYCLVSPTKGVLNQANTTLSDLHIATGYWRLSKTTSTIYIEPHQLSNNKTSKLGEENANIYSMSRVD